MTRPVYRQEPVFDAEVTYQVQEWQAVRTARAEGADLEPRWPQLEPGERERPGSRREACRVHLASSAGKRFNHEVRAEELPRYEPGRAFRGKVDAFGTLRSLRPTRVEAGG